MADGGDGDGDGNGDGDGDGDVIPTPSRVLRVELLDHRPLATCTCENTLIPPRHPYFKSSETHTHTVFRCYCVTFVAIV